MPRVLWSIVGALAVGGFIAEVAAYDGIVEKVFELPAYTTTGGETIKDIRIGWEAYGELNEAKDNVILITHYFSGTSHAAGRYAEDDPAPGYWDYLIGPGKPIDTDEFYVVSSDTLVNLNVGLPDVVTTGPASIDPDTGGPYGMDFPIVTIRDFVNVQKALLESLGISRLEAVMGASMGALQAYEWAVAYPGMVERLVAVIGAGVIDAFNVGWIDIWAAPIRLDPNWNGGDYYGKKPPLAGLTEALKIVTLHAQHWEWADETYGRAWAEEGKNPAASFDHQFAIEAALEQAGAARAAVADANHFLYLAKANQLFVAGHGEALPDALARIDAPTLIIHQPEDLIFYPALVQQTASLIGADGTPLKRVEIAGARGHLDGVLSLAQVGDVLEAFLEQ
jgi:homoserine O-acetyltransferase/O-succinyltransferase